MGSLYRRQRVSAVQAMHTSGAAPLKRIASGKPTAVPKISRSWSANEASYNMLYERDNPV